MELKERFQDCLEISIDLKARLICSRWLHYIDSCSFRDALLHVASQVDNFNLTLWLHDARNLTAPDVLDQKWTIEDLMMRLEKTELKKVALVMPGDYIMHMIGADMRDKIYRAFGEKIKLECFSRTSHGLHWLNSSDETADSYLAM